MSRDWSGHHGTEPSPIMVEMIRRLKHMPVDKKEHMRLVITGEADKDLIAKGDVYDIIRKVIIETVSSPSSHEIQRALRDVQIAVSKKERAKGPLTARLGDR